MTSNRSLRSSITDVPGVRVGHLTVAEGEVQTGVTAVLPFSPSVRHRKLFLGAFEGGSASAWTGREVAEDFGTLASPIVLCNATAMGAAYDALIARGYRRDAELPVDDAWPPVVIGIDDGYLNDLRRRRVGHEEVLRALDAVSDAAPARGSVGIGRGLAAFGGKGGVGDFARTARVGASDCTVGVLVAANGGGPLEGVRSVAPGFVVIVATDAPLWPEELRALAEGALRGMDAAPVRGADARLALAFSTGNAIDGSVEAPPARHYQARRVGDDGLAILIEAAAGACRAALGRALTDAVAVTGRKGRTAAPLPPDTIARICP
jgi:D-aminopeptidase